MKANQLIPSEIDEFDIPLNAIEKSNKAEILEEALQILREDNYQTRTDEEVDLLVKATEDIDFFKTMNSKKKNVENNIHQKCCRRLKYEFHSCGSTLLNVGEPAKKFYIILSGEVNILIPKDPNEIQKLIQEYKTLYPQIYQDALIKDYEMAYLPEEYKEKYITPIIGFAGGMDHHKLVQLLSEHIPYRNLAGGIDWSSISEFKKYFKEGVFTYTFAGNIKKGNVFGELAFMLKKPRSVTIMAKVNSELGVIDKEDYEEILLQLDQKELNDKIDFFVQALAKDIARDTVTKFAYLFTKKKYAHNQVIFKEGDPVINFFLLKSGEIKLFKEVEINSTKTLQGKETYSPQEKFQHFFKKRIKKSLLDVEIISAGNFFGDEVLLDIPTHQISAIVKSHKASIYFVQKEKFLKFIETMNSQKKLLVEKAKLKSSWMIEKYKQISGLLSTKDREHILSIKSRESPERTVSDSINRKYNSFQNKNQNFNDFYKLDVEKIIDQGELNKWNNNDQINNEHNIKTVYEHSSDNLHRHKREIHKECTNLTKSYRKNHIINYENINNANEKTIKLLMRQSSADKSPPFLNTKLHKSKTRLQLNSIEKAKQENKSSLSPRFKKCASATLIPQRQIFLAKKAKNYNFNPEIYITMLEPTKSQDKRTQRIPKIIDFLNDVNKISFIDSNQKSLDKSISPINTRVQNMNSSPKSPIIFLGSGKYSSKKIILNSVERKVRKSLTQSVLCTVAETNGNPIALGTASMLSNSIVTDKFNKGSTSCLQPDAILKTDQSETPSKRNNALKKYQTSENSTLADYIKDKLSNYKYQNIPKFTQLPRLNEYHPNSARDIPFDIEKDNLRNISSNKKRQNTSGQQQQRQHLHSSQSNHIRTKSKSETPDMLKLIQSNNNNTSVNNNTNGNQDPFIISLYREPNLYYSAHKSKRERKLSIDAVLKKNECEITKILCMKTIRKTKHNLFRFQAKGCGIDHMKI